VTDLALTDVADFGYRESSSMLVITNYANGELEISTDSLPVVRMNQEQANRLILFARMHPVSDFVASLSRLMQDKQIAQAVLSCFELLKTSSERWNLKEKFARLRTVTSGFPSGSPDQVTEKIIFR